MDNKNCEPFNHRFGEHQGAKHSSLEESKPRGTIYHLSILNQPIGKLLI